MNWMQMRTAEEKKAIAAKAKETRKRNIEERNRLLNEKLEKSDGLKRQITELELKLGELKQQEKFSFISSMLTGKTLHTAEEIVQASEHWGNMCGVYFLVDEDEVVYVGQSVNAFSRISQHRDKKFNKYAFIKCDQQSLDLVESLYIHALRPKLNGNNNNECKASPINFENIIKLMSKS